MKAKRARRGISRNNVRSALASNREESATADQQDHSTHNLILRPARKAVARRLIIQLLVTGAGILMIAKGLGQVGWPFAILGALLVAMSGIELCWPNASYLELSPEGFVTRTALRRQPLVQWNTVTEFRTSWTLWGPTVAYDFAASSRARFWVEFILAALAFILRDGIAVGGGSTATSLPDTYGHTAGELAGLMNQWRKRAHSRKDNAKAKVRPTSRG